MHKFRIGQNGQRYSSVRRSDTQVRTSQWIVRLLPGMEYRIKAKSEPNEPIAREPLNEIFG